MHRKTSWEIVRGTIRIVCVSVILVLIGVVLYFCLWDGAEWRTWTGFGEYKTLTGEYHRPKTLWDWLDLLVVPAVLTYGAWLLNRAQADRQYTIAAQQADSARELALDQQRQTMFETYLAQMTDLLLVQSSNHQKANSIVRTRTLTVLRNLDGQRKGHVIMFLYESNMITINSNLLDLKHADARGIHLVWANLEGVNLEGSHLSDAQLKWAHLENANLANTLLINADLQGGYLQGTKLQNANLAGANLRKANLEKANLEHAHLEGADLSNAILKETNLLGARFNQSTQWPIGFDISIAGVINVDIEKDKAEFYPGA